MEVSPVPTGPATGTGGAIVPSQAEAERAIPKAGSESMFEFKKIECRPEAAEPKPVPAAVPLPEAPVGNMAGDRRDLAHRRRRAQRHGLHDHPQGPYQDCGRRKGQ